MTRSRDIGIILPGGPATSDLSAKLTRAPQIEILGRPPVPAPGQGIVEYRAGMGVPFKTTDKLVIQIHYNLGDRASAGKSHSTTVPRAEDESTMTSSPSLSSSTARGQ